MCHCNIYFYGFESRADRREEAHSDPLVTLTSVLLSLLPPCGVCVSTVLDASSGKQMLDVVVKDTPFKRAADKNTYCLTSYI